MGQQDLYKKILQKRKKGKDLSDKERNAVEELMHIDGKIQSYESEIEKIEDHVRWLKVKVDELRTQKHDILSSFDPKPAENGGEEDGKD